MTVQRMMHPPTPTTTPTMTLTLLFGGGVATVNDVVEGMVAVIVVEVAGTFVVGDGVAVVGSTEVGIVFSVVSIDIFDAAADAAVVVVAEDELMSVDVDPFITTTIKQPTNSANQSLNQSINQSNNQSTYVDKTS